MAELTKQFEPHIRSIRLITSHGGRFEVTVDGDLVYSKQQTQRHPEPGEVAGLVAGRLSKPD